MKIGARTVKTGFAIFLALILPISLGYRSEAALAGISVVASMEPSLRKSFVTLRNRVFSNSLGGLLAVLIGLTLGNAPLYIGLGAILLIAILHHLNMNNMIALSTMTLIIIMLNPLNNIAYSAVTRVIATLYGVLVAFVVNSFIFPPKYDRRLYEQINTVTDELNGYIRIALRKNMQFAVMRNDIGHIQEQLIEMNILLDLIKDGKISQLFVKDERSFARLIVVYRQFISTIQSAHHLLKVMHSSENVYNKFPDDLRILIRERTETLIQAHEQILQKWNGRILPDEVNFIAYKADLRMTFMEALFNEANVEAYKYDEYDERHTVINLMSAILEYEKSLQRLNRLVTSYKKNHEDDKEAEFIQNELQ